MTPEIAKKAQEIFATNKQAAIATARGLKLSDDRWPGFFVNTDGWTYGAVDYTCVFTQDDGKWTIDITAEQHLDTIDAVEPTKTEQLLELEREMARIQSDACRVCIKLRKFDDEPMARFKELDGIMMDHWNTYIEHIDNMASRLVQ